MKGLAPGLLGLLSAQSTPALTDALRPDADAMTVISPGTIAFDRVLGVAPILQITRYLTRHQQALPAAPSHDAIEDNSEKASLVYYCHAGRWLTLPGAD